jgi:hypothetical protein
MKSRLEHIDENFKKELDEIIGEQRKRGNKLSYRRLTKAIPRTSLWMDMKTILKNSDIKSDVR